MIDCGERYAPKNCACMIHSETNMYIINIIIQGVNIQIQNKYILNYIYIYSFLKMIIVNMCKYIKMKTT